MEVIKKLSFITTFSILLILGVFKNILKADELHYREVPNRMVKAVSPKVPLASFVDATSYLPRGYVVDGSEDYTKYLQAAIDENQQIKMPNFLVLINDEGLKLRDGSHLFFQANSKLLLAPSKKANYGVLTVAGVSNVKIFHPRIVGDRKRHLDNKGEWGMGINILSSHNVEIINPIVSECWGDGIYLGVLDNSKSNVNSNITIRGGWIDNNRRNGISIISGSNISVEDIVLSNTHGTLPMAGIDLEPNSNSEELNNVTMKRVTSYNNGDAGFLIYLGSMLGRLQKTLNVNMTNCVDYFSPNAISIPGLRHDYDKSKQRLNGGIIINGFSAYDSKEVFARSSGNYVYTPKISANKIRVYNRNKRNSSVEGELRTWMSRRNFDL